MVIGYGYRFIRVDMLSVRLITIVYYWLDTIESVIGYRFYVIWLGY